MNIIYILIILLLPTSRADYVNSVRRKSKDIEKDCFLRAYEILTKTERESDYEKSENRENSAAWNCGIAFSCNRGFADNVQARDKNSHHAERA